MPAEAEPAPESALEGAPKEKKSPPSMFTTFTFYARVLELLMAVLYADQLPGLENNCYFLSQACYGYMFALWWHMIFFLIPMRGKLKFFKAWRITSPFSSMWIVLWGMLAVCWVMWLWDFSGEKCQVLRDISYMGVTPSILYFLAIRCKESGKCQLYKE